MSINVGDVLLVALPILSTPSKVTKCTPLGLLVRKLRAKYRHLASVRERRIVRSVNHHVVESSCNGALS